MGNDDVRSFAQGAEGLGYLHAAFEFGQHFFIDGHGFLNFFLRPGEPAVGACVAAFTCLSHLFKVFARLRHIVFKFVNCPPLDRQDVGFGSGRFFVINDVAVRRILRSVGRKDERVLRRNKRVLPHNERIFRLDDENLVVRAGGHGGNHREAGGGDQRTGDQTGQRRVFPDVFHGKNPLFNTCHAEAAHRRRGGTRGLHLQQRERIGPLGGYGALRQHALVAEQLHVSIDEEEQKEYRRVEPVQTKRCEHQQLAPRIQRADVHHFVFQHEKQAVPIHALGQEDDRMQQAVGKRRRNAAAQADLHAAADRMRLQKRRASRVVVRQGLRKRARAADVGGDEIQRQTQRDSHPDHQQSDANRFG